MRRLLVASLLVAGCGNRSSGNSDLSVTRAHDMSMPVAGDLASPLDLTAGNDLVSVVVHDLASSPDLWIRGTCSDNMQDQNETDIDCGGTICRKCAPTQKCLVDGDCLDGTCGADKTCTQVCPTVDNAAPASVCPGGAGLQFSGAHFLPGAFMYINGTTSIAARVDVSSSTMALGVWSTLNPGGPYDARITDPARTCFAQLTTTFTVAASGPSSFITDTGLVWNGMTTPISVSAGNVTAPIVEVAYGVAPVMKTALTIDSKSANSAVVAVPAGITPSTYDLVLTDSNTSGCTHAIDPNALTVVGGAPAFALTVSPASGSAAAQVPLDITAPAASANFSPDVHVYLVPHASPTSEATRTLSFHLVDAGHVQATVPSAIAAVTYDVVTVGVGGVGRSTLVYTAN